MPLAEQEGDLSATRKVGMNANEYDRMLEAIDGVAGRLSEMVEPIEVALEGIDERMKLCCEDIAGSTRASLRGLADCVDELNTTLRGMAERGLVSFLGAPEVPGTMIGSLIHRIRTLEDYQKAFENRYTATCAVLANLEARFEVTQAKPILGL